MTQSAKFLLNAIMSYSKTDEMSTLTDFLNQTFGLTFSEGVGDNQINLIFHDERPLAKGVTENPVIDFNDGSLTNKVSQAITIDKLKALLIKNNSTDSTLIVGGDADNVPIFGLPANTEVIPPLGVKLFLAPLDGVDITADSKMKMVHGDEGTSAPDYQIIVAGVDVP